MATPAAGCTWVARRVTAAGPTMKHSSSATDSIEKAVCSRGVPASSTDQRARAIGPSCGMVAPPTIPQTNSVQSGSAELHGGHQAGHRQREDHADRHQHPVLAEPVDQPSQLRRAERVAERADRRHGPASP